MKIFPCGNKFNDTLKLHKLILQFLTNIREFFQVDRINNYEMIDRRKVCRITLTQKVLRRRKNYVSAPKVKQILKE